MQLFEISYLLGLNIAVFCLVIKKERGKGTLLSSCHALYVYIFIAINKNFVGSHATYLKGLKFSAQQLLQTTRAWTFLPGEDFY